MSTFDAPTMVGLGRVESVKASPDGSWLAVAVSRLDSETSSKFVSDIWRVSSDGESAVKLTHGKWNDRAPAFRHDGALMFLSNRPTGTDDEGHDKRSQVFVFPVIGGEPVCLTQEPLGVSSFAASDEIDVFVVETSLLPDVEYAEQRKTMKDRSENGPSELVYDEMPVRYWDHWLPNQVSHLVAYENGARARDLTPNAGAEMHRAAWSLAPDGTFVVLSTSAELAVDRVPQTESTRIDTSTGAARTLAVFERSGLGSVVIHPDGRRVAMSRHRRRDGMLGSSDILVVDSVTGAVNELPIDKDLGLLPVAWFGDDLLLSGALRTHRPVFRFDLASDELQRVTNEAAGGTHDTISVNGDHIVGLCSSIVQPPEVFRCALTEGATPEVLTKLSGFEGASFAEVENHEVVSTDGTMVQYRVVKPAGAEGPLPCIMAIHGGPISDWGDVWHWRWNSLALAAQGHVVALPNPRGSTGFGQEFIEGIWNNSWGGQCYEDLMAVADDLAARPDVDAARMVAMGGSFGGYMSNWIGTQTDRFKCLITHASIFDLAGFHGVTDLPAWWAFSFGIQPYGEREAFQRYSPIEHVANWKSPTLIIHGDRDYRVPIGESLSLFEALRFHGVDAKLLVYPDENHWILRPNNVISWYRNVLDFIGQHTA